jgi:hypothetical protein
MIKLAFSITLLRIIDRRVYPFAAYATYIVMIVALVPAVFFFFYILFACKPVTYLWEQLDPSKKGSCNSEQELMSLSYAQSAFYFFCDASLAIIPAFVLSKLRLSRKTKVSAGILLGLGAA